MPRRSAADAAGTRTAILDRAVHVASLEGLEGLTIGRLADDLRMSKSGLIGHFGSKESLQIATLEDAIATFRAEVWDPVAGREPGLDRLTALVDRWLAHLADCPFPGGCFLTGAAVEFDGRRGPVRDLVEETWDLWNRTLRHDAKLAGFPDPAQTAFEIEAIAQGLNQTLQLRGDRRAPGRARRMAAKVLRSDLA